MKATFIVINIEVKKKMRNKRIDKKVKKLNKCLNIEVDIVFNIEIEWK